MNRSEMSLDRSLRSIAFDILNVRDGSGGWKAGRVAFLRSAASSRSDNDAAAMKALRSILIHAFSTSPLYRRTWTALGFDPRAADLQPERDLARLPFLTKDIIREHRDELISTAIPPDQLQLSYTGGTTGTQTSFFLDRRCMTQRVGRQWGALQLCGYRPGMRRALVWGVHSDLPPDGVGANLKRWFRAYASAQEILCCTVMTEEALGKYYRRLRKFSPSVLYGYPSALCQLGAYIHDRSLPSIEVARILTTAERLTAQQRRFLQDTFAGEVFNLYCTREYGCIGFECSRHAGFHIDNQSVHVEIIKEGRRAAPHESGEITVTDLMNQGMPFIRSRTGDVGALSAQPCECGLPLPLLTGLDGRATDLILRPDGSVIAGIMLADLFLELPAIRFAQFIQTAIDDIEVLVETTGDYSALIEATAIAEVKQIVGPQMAVRISRVGEIPRNPRSGKFREVISRLAHVDGLAASVRHVKADMDAESFAPQDRQDA